MYVVNETHFYVCVFGPKFVEDDCMVWVTCLAVEDNSCMEVSVNIISDGVVHLLLSIVTTLDGHCCTTVTTLLCS